MNDDKGGSGGDGGLRRIRQNVSIDLGAGVLLEVDVTVGILASGVIVQPPPPRPKARLVLEDFDPAGGIGLVEVNVQRNR